MSDDFVSVKKLNDYVKSYLDSNKILNNIRVRGEILNFKAYPTGLYFTLKDPEDYRISVVMFLYGNKKVEKLKDGDDVIITGQVSLYVKSGTYQLIARDIEYFGEGAKLLALKKLKEKLAATGIFDQSKKMPIPRFAKRIGVISGKDSAAWADIRQNISRRYPLAELYYFPTLVQGEEAPKAIIAAFKKSEAYNLDVLIIARGGGSSDDLWAFNDEELVIELSKRKTPLISAVGHEIDTTLVDYVSDLRVSTPTAAAEHAVENVMDIAQDIHTYRERIDSALNNRLSKIEDKLNSLVTRQVLMSPLNLIKPIEAKINDLNLRLTKQFDRHYHRASEKITILHERLITNAGKCISQLEERYERLDTKLIALSPLNVLERGYAIILDENHQVIKDASQVRPGDLIQAKLYKQAITATVKEVKDNE